MGPSYDDLRKEADEIREAKRAAERLTGRSVMPNAYAAAERVLGKYGLATLLAIAFFWWVTSDVSGILRNVQATLNDHVSESNFYLRQICLNSARDEAQRAGCIPPEKHR